MTDSKYLTLRTQDCPPMLLNAAKNLDAKLYPNHRTSEWAFTSDKPSPMVMKEFITVELRGDELVSFVLLYNGFSTMHVAKVAHGLEVTEQMKQDTGREEKYLLSESLKRLIVASLGVSDCQFFQCSVCEADWSLRMVLDELEIPQLSYIKPAFNVLQRNFLTLSRPSENSTGYSYLYGMYIQN